MAKTNNKDELELRVKITDPRAIEVLNSIDFGFKRKFIESAILNFAKNQPSIRLHFDGITNLNKRGRKPKGIKEVAAKNEMAIQADTDIEKKGVVDKILEGKEETKSQKSKMMFNF